MSFVREECWVLVGEHANGIWFAQRRQPSAGSRAQVAFDAAWVLEREEQHGDVVGFYHTHPPGNPAPSPRDLRTMRAWVSAFGKALLCVIESDGRREAYRFDDDASKGIQIHRVEVFSGDYCVGVDKHGGPNTPRGNLPRRRTGRKTGQGKNRPVRSRRARIEPGG